jgi:NAD+ kinase
MTAGVITNAHKDADYEYTRQACAYLTAKNVKFVLDDTSTVVDFWLVLGGDGTMLRASHYAAVLGVPMLGINLGTLGYLTDADRKDGFSSIEKVLRGEYKKESRLMLEIERDACGINERLALNDVYLSRLAGKLTTFDLRINGMFIDTIRADGVIVATPTGSTAYNLSAGGPILMPDGDMMVVTFVCPHTLYIRPWVVSSVDEVSISPAISDVACALDGEERFTLHPGESITIKRSIYRADIIKTSPPHFYETLRRKMKT